MSELNGFLQTAAGGLGISTDDAGAATGGLLKLIMDKVSEQDAASLMQAVPGASELLSTSRNPSGGGMLGGLMSSAGKLVGGKAGAALGVMSIFKNANLDGTQAASFSRMFFDMVSKNAGPDLVSRILGQIPDLKGLVGD